MAISTSEIIQSPSNDLLRGWNHSSSTNTNNCDTTHKNNDHHNQHSPSSRGRYWDSIAEKIRTHQDTLVLKAFSIGTRLRSASPAPSMSSTDSRSTTMTGSECDDTEEVRCECDEVEDASCTTGCYVRSECEVEVEEDWDNNNNNNTSSRESIGSGCLQGFQSLARAATPDYEYSNPAEDESEEEEEEEEEEKEKANTPDWSTTSRDDSIRGFHHLLDSNPALDRPATPEEEFDENEEEVEKDLVKITTNDNNEEVEVEEVTEVEEEYTLNLPQVSAVRNGSKNGRSKPNPKSKHWYSHTHNHHQQQSQPHHKPKQVKHKEKTATTTTNHHHHHHHQSLNITKKIKMYWHKKQRKNQVKLIRNINREYRERLETKSVSNMSKDYIIDDHHKNNRNNKHSGRTQHNSNSSTNWLTRIRQKQRQMRKIHNDSIPSLHITTRRRHHHKSKKVSQPQPQPPQDKRFEAPATQNMSRGDCPSHQPCSSSSSYQYAGVRHVDQWSPHTPPQQRQQRQQRHEDQNLHTAPPPPPPPVSPLTSPPTTTRNPPLLNVIFKGLHNRKEMKRCLSSLSSDQSLDDMTSEAIGVLCEKEQEVQQQQRLPISRDDDDDGDTTTTTGPRRTLHFDIDHPPPPPCQQQDDDDNDNNNNNILAISVKNRVRDIELKEQAFDDDDDEQRGCMYRLSHNNSSLSSITTTTSYTRPPQCIFEFLLEPPPRSIVLPSSPYHHLQSITFGSACQRPSSADCASVATSGSDSTSEEEDEALNHTLKVVILGGGGSGALSNSLRMDSQSQHHSRRTARGVKEAPKGGVSLSVKSWSPSDDARNSMGGNYNSSSSSCSSSCSSSLDGHTNPNFNLWEIEGSAKDSHHATQSICFSPNTLYIIVYQVPPTTTLTSSHYTNNNDTGSGDNPDDDELYSDFAQEQAQEDAHQKSQDELHRHMDEHFFSWVDLLSQRAPLEGCAILPVVSFDEEHTNGGWEDDDQRIRDCCDLLKKRIKEERDWNAGVDMDHLDMDWNGSMSLQSSSSSSSSSSLKFVNCDEIPRIFPSRSDGSIELRHALCNLGSWNSVFHRHLYKEITPLVSCLRKILSSYREEKYYVLPLDELHDEVVDMFPEINHEEIIDALKFLSSVGDIIYFTKEDDGCRETANNQSVLSKFVILEPRWMAAVVSCILRDDWKVIRKNLKNGTTTHNRQDSNVSILHGCIRNDKFSCPILSPQDTTKIWGKAPFIKKMRDKLSKLGSDDHLLLFIRKACEHCGILVPFPIDEAASSLATKSDSSAVRYYLLPGLCQETPEHIENIFSFKSKEAWKTTLCQSWLLNDRIPCGMFDQIKITALEELGGIVDSNHNTTDTNNTTTKIRVSQLLCYKTALYVKLIEKKEGMVSIVEFFIHLVRSDSLQCPASYTLDRGMKLVVSAKGHDAHDCDIIWRLGYRNILDSIESVVKKALGVEVEREVSCPDCMANSDPCEANVWKIDDNSFYEQMDPTMRCTSGHRVSTKMIYGSRDDDTDATTVCTACSCTSSSTTSTHLRNDNPGKSTEELLGAVVLVGLWDTDNECIVDVGTGFVADSSAGLIITAGHIFYDLKQGSKVGPKYKGYKNARAVIGTIHKSEEGDEAFFTYSAEIVSDDITNVDAVVLRITTKFENPIQCPLKILKLQSDVPIHHGKFKREKTKKLKLMKSHIDEQIRIIGFIQRGQGIYEQGHIINHTPSVAKGYVCNIKNSMSPIEEYGPGIFSPRSEIVIECTSFPGQSGGPCVNQDGKVIGIVSRQSPNDQRRCYLAPTSELKKILRKAKSRISSKKR